MHCSRRLRLANASHCEYWALYCYCRSWGSHCVSVQYSAVCRFWVQSWTATFLNQALNSQKSTASDPTCSWSVLCHMTMMLSSGSSVISVVLMRKVQFMLKHGFSQAFSPENTVQECFFGFFGFLIFNKNGCHAAGHRLRDEYLNSFFKFPNVLWENRELRQAAKGESQGVSRQKVQPRHWKKNVSNSDCWLIYRNWCVCRPVWCWCYYVCKKMMLRTGLRHLLKWETIPSGIGEIVSVSRSDFTHRQLDENPAESWRRHRL